MPLELAITVSGLLSPFFIQFLRWVQFKITSDVFKGWAMFGLTLLYSVVVAIITLVYTKTEFSITDILYNGSALFGISQAIYQAFVRKSGLRIKLPIS